VGGFAKHGHKLAKAFDGNGSDNRIPVLEMRIENRLAVFDLVGETPDRHGVPSFALGDDARRRDDALLALGPFPAFPLGGTQSRSPASDLPAPNEPEHSLHHTDA